MIPDMMQTFLCIIMTEVQKVAQVAQFALHTKISDGQLAGYIGHLRCWRPSVNKIAPQI